MQTSTEKKALLLEVDSQIYIYIQSSVMSSNRAPENVQSVCKTKMEGKWQQAS